MIFTKDVFNNASVNIFTDASILNINNMIVGCAGYCTVIDSSIINYGYKFIQETSNNEAEFLAIYLGLEQLQRYNNSNYNLRLFSDSQTSIFALRDRIFNWIKPNKDHLIGSNNKPVANEKMIMQCVELILRNELNIGLYHQKGHVSINNMESILNAANVFKNSNYISDDIELDIIVKISYANDYVDKFTKEKLREYSVGNIKYPVSIIFNRFNIDKYSSLVNRNGGTLV